MYILSCFIPPNSNTLYLVNKILMRKFERYEWSDIQFGGIIGFSVRDLILLNMI